MRNPSYEFEGLKEIVVTLNEDKIEEYLDSLVKKGYAKVKVVNEKKVYGMTKKGLKTAEKLIYERVTSEV